MVLTLELREPSSRERPAPLTGNEPAPSGVIVAQDCFNAVFEATKGLAERIREMTGLDLDRHRLVAAAFESDTPGWR